jgi:hypothetical protein
MRNVGMTGSSMLVAAMAIAFLGSAVPTPAIASHKATTLQLVGVLEGGSRVQRRSYSMRQLRDLRITGWWNVSGAHVQRLEIRAPDGSLYQRRTQPFTASRAGLLHVGGDPLQRGTPVRGVLPVGGTWITEYSLVGTWQIDLYLDDSRTPIASRSFELTP